MLDHQKKLLGSLDIETIRAWLDEIARYGEMQYRRGMEYATREDVGLWHGTAEAFLQEGKAKGFQQVKDIITMSAIPAPMNCPNTPFTEAAMEIVDDYDMGQS